MVFLWEALGLCALFTVLVFRSVYHDPMNWITSYPPAIQRRAREIGLVPPEQKKMPAHILARKLLGCLLGALLMTCLLVRFNGAETFRQGFFLSCGLWLAVDWYDALVLDCLWFCHDRRVILPGTEDMVQDYHDYLFHIKMSGIGMVLGLPVCLLTGLLVTLIA